MKLEAKIKELEYQLEISREIKDDIIKEHGRLYDMLLSLKKEQRNMKKLKHKSLNNIRLEWLKDNFSEDATSIIRVFQWSSKNNKIIHLRP